ncbi:MAG: DUF4339 domain-containing protein [Planctomycetaceae bacterium]|jgi:hypothetical protein|nr:DUF4339 domain-containing protein [Planctomycetaceae bacterium]
MANFFLTDAEGNRRGPYYEQQLQAMAAQGTITPSTPLESDTGHKGLAGQIPGLFPVAPPSPFPSSRPGTSSTTEFSVAPGDLKEAWSTGLMVLFCILSAICPIFGWIMGGLNMSPSKHSEGRRNQALAMIIIGVVFFFFWMGAA